MLFLAKFPECLIIYGKACLMISVMAGLAQYCTVFNVKIEFIIYMAGDDMMRLKIIFSAACLAAVVFT